MADIDSVVVEVEFDGKKGLVTLKKDAEKVGKDSGELLGSNIGAGVALGIKGKLAAIAATIGGALFSKATIEAALESEVAVGAFNKTLQRTGIYTNAVSEDFQKFASGLQSSLNISDEKILDTANKIQNLGNLSAPSLKRATQAAADLSKALGIDLDTAATMVGKAAEGNIGTFGRYGIRIQESADKTVTFQNALTELERRFGGASRAADNTFGSALDSLKLNFGDVLENIGKLVTQSPAAVAILKKLSEAFKGLADFVESFGKKDLIKELVNALVPFAQAVNMYLVAPIELAYNIIQGVLFTLAGALTFFVQGIIKFIEPVFNLIGNFGGTFGSKIKEQFDVINQTVDATYAQLNEKTEKAFGNLFDFKIAQAVDNSLVSLQKLANEAPAIAAKASANVADKLTPWQESLKKLESAINKAGETIVSSSLSKGFEAFGSALAKGQNSFDAFGKAILGSLGDFAIQIGGLMIATAIGVTQLKVALSTFNPVGLFIAGAALIAIGGALKAISSAGASGPAGSSASVSGGVAAEPTSVSQEPVGNQGPKTSVTINVEGNILDRRESGLAIAEIIQEHFDNSSGVLVTS